MLGWKIYVCLGELDAGGNEESFMDSPALIASWEVNLSGTKWLDDLVAEGKAEKLADDGYPDLYTAEARYVLGAILDGPPHKGSGLVVGDDYVQPPGWISEVVVNSAIFEACHDGDTVTVAAWDLS